VHLARTGPKAATKPESFAFVLFRATGDLAKRKILPALFEAHRAGLLPADGKIVGVELSEEQQIQASRSRCVAWGNRMS
jgi:glucose-6-phosphate 1-dehydrogenase